MESFFLLLNGFQAVLSPELLFFCFLGVTIGTAIGCLPGIGPLATIGLLLPFTFYLDPVTGLVMLSGIYYGSMYGSSTAAIMLNIPGTSASAITCLDGYPMAQQGRAGLALLLTTLASFIGGLIGVVFLIAFAPALGSLAVSFASAEYFSLILFALVISAFMAQGSFYKGFPMICLGVLMGMVGTDIDTGVSRFDFGILELRDGIGLVPVVTGLFGLSELLSNAASSGGWRKPQAVSLRSLIPTRSELKAMWAPSFRGSAIGSFLGSLPGAGPTIATFISYGFEKRRAKDPSRFGKGAIEGICAPESANNAATQTGFIPTLTLGIPGDAVMAVLLGVLLIHGIPTGPRLITEHADLFWTLVASFVLGNVLLLILNLPLIGIWVRLLSLPSHILYACVIVLVCIGVYSMRFSAFDVLLMVFFGFAGVLFRRVGLEAAPLILGFVLGPLLEENLRRALLIARGDLLTFAERPISALFLGLSALVLVHFIYGQIRRKPLKGAAAEP